MAAFHNSDTDKLDQALAHPQLHYLDRPLQALAKELSVPFSEDYEDSEENHAAQTVDGAIETAIHTEVPEEVSNETAAETDMTFPSPPAAEDTKDAGEDDDEVDLS